MATSIHETIRVAYETIPYVGRPFHETHPNRLLAVAQLHGLAAPKRDTISVLELGSGDGSNLLPIAAAYPRGHFVGVDLSDRLTASARAMAQGLGIPNVSLHRADLRKLPDGLRLFDIVLAHGLYSWVPADVRDALLRTIRQHLAPGGVAYVNYNLLPGGWLRRIGWEAMQFHTRGTADPAERVARAREFIALLVETWRPQPGPGAALALHFERESDRDDSGIYHDDLAPQNEPVYYSTFAQHAKRHGLDVIGDVDPGAMGHGATGTALRQRLAARDPLSRDQMLDFANLRQMRQSLLAMSGAVVGGGAARPARRLAGLHFAATMAYMRHRLAGDAPPDALGDLLAPRFPASASVESLVDALRSRGIADGEARSMLVHAWTLGMADPYVDALAVATVASARPRASVVARWQAPRSPLVTNLRHVNVRLADELARAVLAQCDGTRTIAEIVLAVHDALPPAETATPQAAVERRLAQLASAALFDA
jgi:SAM-dependent methyltransferase